MIIYLVIYPFHSKTFNLLFELYRGKFSLKKLYQPYLNDHIINSHCLQEMFYPRRKIFISNLLDSVSNMFYPILSEIHQMKFDLRSNTLNYNPQSFFGVII